MFKKWHFENSLAKYAKQNIHVVADLNKNFDVLKISYEAWEYSEIVSMMMSIIRMSLIRLSNKDQVYAQLFKSVFLPELLMNAAICLDG